jgi:hypothetical protein
MEKIMSKTYLNCGTKTAQGRDALRDDELNAVSGGGGGQVTFSNIDVQAAYEGPDSTGGGGSNGVGGMWGPFHIHYKN